MKIKDRRMMRTEKSSKTLYKVFWSPCPQMGLMNRIIQKTRLLIFALENINLKDIKF